MQKEMNIQNVANDIRKVLSLNPGLIMKIGIFGSLAHGDYNNESDIDLLVRYDSPSVFSMEKIARYCELCCKIQEDLSTFYQRSVDIVDVEDDSLSNMYDTDVINEVVWI
ncbi:MAG: nucleotidyltransferase domain-containing protein [Clostridiales bacterium]|nr:nucleotidyltransferase domain-containing protein [Clostridiales bacterium]